MKRVVLLISLVSLFVLSSCSVEDAIDIKEAIKNETLTPETLPLIGSWQLESAVLGNGIDVTNECFMEEIITFNINGTYIDRRNQINEDTGACEMVGEFVRGFNSSGDIFETEANELVIANYEMVNRNELTLNFSIPFEATVTYKRIRIRE